MDQQQGHLFVISAPSGAGKSSLVTGVLERLKPKYSIDRIVTYTTRAPRTYDIPGQDYHFITPEEFEAKIAQEFFLEWSKAYAAYYGSPALLMDDIKRGLFRIIIVDRLGARSLMQRGVPATLIWIAVDSVQMIQERLIARSTETPQQLEHRLLRAQQELLGHQIDNYFHYTIINHVFENALSELELIINSKIAELLKKKDL